MQLSCYSNINYLISMSYLNRLLLLCTLLTLLAAITIPIGSDKERCMIVYTTLAEDFLKVDLKFKSFHGQKKDEFYKVTLLNTQTQEPQVFFVTQGNFRRQFSLTENVIYKICMQIILTRAGEIQEKVEYTAGVEHLSGYDDLSLKIPDSLLKVGDLSKTYTEMNRINKVFDYSKRVSDEHRKQEQEIHEEQLTVMGKIEWISILELLGVVIIGLYQYYHLRNIIKEKSFL